MHGCLQNSASRRTNERLELTHLEAKLSPDEINASCSILRAVRNVIQMKNLRSEVNREKNCVQRKHSGVILDLLIVLAARDRRVPVAGEGLRILTSIVTKKVKDAFFSIKNDSEGARL